MALFNKSVDGLVADFTTLIDKLRARASHHILQAGVHSDYASKHKQKADEHFKESARAAIIAERINKIVAV